MNAKANAGMICPSWYVFPLTENIVAANEEERFCPDEPVRRAAYEVGSATYNLLDRSIVFPSKIILCSTENLGLENQVGKICIQR
ncbi:hypothetical protein BDV41DRAFT_532867 [Aspergillus transmontanensis]|uniref:Uncharacterized protein n=1 Tax=Aspergillus transmontanensis TaxID=1034304 RepID=A0A5N6W1X2_9EURO|nr:hypothetical protein BDV41DRAFT_532867 [Aspergillus transmontanensis]